MDKNLYFIDAIILLIIKLSVWKRGCQISFDYKCYRLRVFHFKKILKVLPKKLKIETLDWNV